MNKSLVEETIYSWEGWLFNLICAGYFVFISPFVKEATVSAIHDEGIFIPWLGIALITISLLEIYAFPKKMKYVHRAAMKHGEEIKSGFVLWMFHAVISIVITFTALESFGYNVVPEEGVESEPSGWLALLMFAVVIKELYLLFTIIGLHEGINQLEEHQRPNKKEWIIDLILLVYACLAYTATWEAITDNMDMDKHNTVMYIVNLFGASIMFLIFYMPLRIPYHLEEMVQLKTIQDVLKFFFGILVVLASVLVNL